MVFQMVGTYHAKLTLPTDSATDMMETVLSWDLC